MPSATAASLVRQRDSNIPERQLTTAPGKAVKRVRTWNKDVICAEYHRTEPRHAVQDQEHGVELVRVRARPTIYCETRLTSSIQLRGL